MRKPEPSMPDISKNQIGYIYVLLNRLSLTADEVLSELEIARDSVEDLTREEASRVIDWLKEESDNSAP